MASPYGQRPTAVQPAAQSAAQASRVTLDDFNVSPLGSGAMGSVFKAVRKADGRIFALKQVGLKGMSRVERAQALEEARVLAKMNHKHIIRYYDSFMDVNEKLNILMEYAAGGDLSQVLKRTPGKPLPEDFIWKVLIQTALALQYLHKKNIFHRDIKALNIFFDSKGDVKIGDFGVARPITADSRIEMSKAGTPFYLSPEICNDKPFNHKSDIWALGVVVYECMMGKYPFNAQTEAGLYKKIAAGRFDPITGQYTPQLIQLATSLLTFRPEARPDADALLRNPALLSKAKSLSLDLNPKPPTEETPVFERVQAAPAAAPVPAYQQQQPQYPPAGASPGAYMYPDRPGSARNAQQQQPMPGGYSPYQAASPYGNAAPADHPFMMAGGGPGGPAGPYASPAAAAAASPYGASPYAAPYGATPASPYGGVVGAYGSPAAHGGAYASPRQQQPQQPAYVPKGNKNPDDPWDNMAQEIYKIQISETERARHNADRVQGLRANMHAGQRDNLKDLMYNGPQDSGPRVNRPRPEELPAAGARPTSAHNGAPFALHNGGDSAYRSASQANDAWRATYQPPQFGRRRCPELQITGPSLRGGSARGGGGGGYVAAADDATSYVSTSYVTSYQR